MIRLKAWHWALIFAVLTVLVRLGSQSQEVFDGDESTFALMGQDVLRGHLPYLHMFDNKPPLMFLLMAGALRLFGSNLGAIRSVGDVSVFLTALATCWAARRFLPLGLAGIAGCAVIVALASDFSQHSAAELPVAFLAISALGLMLHCGSKFWASILVGLCLALATLTRSNYAIVVLATGLIYAAGFFQLKLGLHKYSCVGFALGGFLPLVGLLAAYWAANGLDVLYLSIVQVPLSYATLQKSAFYNGLVMVKRTAWAMGLNPLTFGLFVLMTALGSVSAYRLYRQRLPRPAGVNLAGRDLCIVAIIFAATFISMLTGGVFYTHYVIQVVPFMAIVGAMAFADPRPLYFRLAVFTAAVAVIGLLIFQLPSSVKLLADRGSVQEGHFVRQAADAIAKDKGPGDRVWPFKYHLVLFYLDQQPLSRAAVQPDNLIRAVIMDPLVAKGYVPANEFQRVMDTTPRYLVFENGEVPPSVFQEYGYSSNGFMAWIQKNYAPWKAFGRLVVYKAKE